MQSSTVLGITDYVVIGFMLAVSACVGLYFRFTGGRQKTTNEFLMGGRNMGIAPVAFSLMATYMSAISVLGIPAETYLYGTQYCMWMLPMPIAAVLAAYGTLPVFYDLQVSTAYEVMPYKNYVYEFFAISSADSGGDYEGKEGAIASQIFFKTAEQREDPKSTNA